MIPSRRDALIGASCVLAAGGGLALKPRREAPLLKGAKMADVVPVKFGPWISEDIGDPYAVNGEGTLSAKLYNELVSRQYGNTETGERVFALFAYGGRQSDELQLHRPEVCYPAFGYDLTRNERTEVKVNGAEIPARRLVAEAEQRSEMIIYWSRMGEMIPQNGGEQRRARLEIAMQGIIPDGLLCRFSTMNSDPTTAWDELSKFISAMLVAVDPPWRKVLVGTALAAAI